MTSESRGPALHKELVPGAARRKPSSSVSGSRVVSLEQRGGSFEKRWRPGGPKFRPNGSLDSRPGDAVPSYSLLQRPTGPRRGPASPMGVPMLPPEIMCFRWLRQVAQ